MDRELSFGEWLNAPRPPLPRPFKTAVISALLIVAGLGTGLWLTYSEPTVKLVAGTPVGVTLDAGPTVRDRAFIAKLLRDLNGNPPYPPNTVSSCTYGLREYDVRFQYADGDQLTIQVRMACGGAIATAGYAPGLMARANQALLDDLDNWPISPP